MLISDGNAAGKVCCESLRALESTEVGRRQYRVCRSNPGFVELSRSDVGTPPDSGV